MMTIMMMMMMMIMMMMRMMKEGKTSNKKFYRKETQRDLEKRVSYHIVPRHLWSVHKCCSCKSTHWYHRILGSIPNRCRRRSDDE